MNHGTSQILNYRFSQTTHTTGKLFIQFSNDFSCREDYQVIMKHLWEKLQSKPKEWRRTAKAMHVMDYLVKNGAPRVVQDIKDDVYKIR
jgi:hypothetical protein